MKENKRYEIRIEGTIPDCIEVDALNPAQAEALAETQIFEALTFTTLQLEEEPTHGNSTRRVPGRRPVR
jgi:hypothetical protein